MRAPVLERVVRTLGTGGDADDVLRAVVAELAEEPDVAWAGIRFLEEGTFVPGPEAGEADPARRLRVPVSYEAVVVGELAIDGTTEAGTLERVAELISTHVLLGWDTGGEAWEP